MYMYVCCQNFVLKVDGDEDVAVEELPVAGRGDAERRLASC